MKSAHFVKQKRRNFLYHNNIKPRGFGALYQIKTLIGQAITTDKELLDMI